MHKRTFDGRLNEMKKDSLDDSLIAALATIVEQHVSWRRKDFLNGNFFDEMIGCIIPSEEDNRDDCGNEKHKNIINQLTCDNFAMIHVYK